jgi:hypothetical protein
VEDSVVTIVMMRTTLNLPADVYEMARSLAGAKRLSLGGAPAELVRDGLRRAPGFDGSKAFPGFAVRDDAPPIGLEVTLQVEDSIT